jgi:N-acetylmuramoyl-L-alanine amidase
MKTIILDAGHGGMINGDYQTKGKRSPVWEDGSQLFEGECNRQIKDRVMELMQFHRMPYYDVNPEQIDISLKERVTRANKISNSLYISIHSNAGGGTGCEVFVSNNCSSKSMSMAEDFQDLYYPLFDGERWRGIKQSDFYVIKNTNMPAVLIESFFMDTEKECKKYLMTKAGRDRIATWVFESIKKMV